MSILFRARVVCPVEVDLEALPLGDIQQNQQLFQVRSILDKILEEAGGIRGTHSLKWRVKMRQIDNLRDLRQ